MSKEHFERFSYQKQLRFLVSVFFVCAALSFTGCRNTGLQFFGNGFNFGNGNGNGNDTNLSSNHGRGSSSDSLTSLPDDNDLFSTNGLDWDALGGNFSPAQNFLMAPFGIRSLAVLNTIPATSLVNAAVGGLVDVVSNSYNNKSYVEYIARFGGGSSDNEWVSARLYMIPPGFENSESFISFDEGPGMYAAIVTKTTARGLQARGKELIASYQDILNPALGIDPKVFLELAVYDMEALLYVNGKLATSGHQCDRNGRGEFGIGGTNGGTVYTMNSVAFRSGPRVFQDYFNQPITPGPYLIEDWVSEVGYFNRVTLGSGGVAVAVPNQRSIAIVPRLQMLYFDVSADVDVRNPNTSKTSSAGVVAKYSGQGHYVGRLKNVDGVVKMQIIKQVQNGSRHNLAEIPVPSNAATGRLRFTVSYESGVGRGQVIRLYFRPAGSAFEGAPLEVVHNGIVDIGSAGIEAENGIIDNFEVRVGEDDRQIENP